MNHQTSKSLVAIKKRSKLYDLVIIIPVILIAGHLSVLFYHIFYPASRSFDSDNLLVEVISVALTVVLLSVLSVYDRKYHLVEERWYTLFETSPDAVLVINPDLTIIMANPPTTKLFAYKSEEDIVGKKALILLAPEERSRALNYKKELLRTGTIKENIEYTMMRKDGTTFQGWLRTSVIRGPKSTPKLMIYVIRDIAESKKVEEVLLSQSAKLTDINEELEALYEISSAITRTTQADILLPKVMNIITGLSVFVSKPKGGIFTVEGEELNLIYQMGHSDGFVELHKRLKVGDCLCGRVAKTGELMVVKDCGPDNRSNLKGDHEKAPHGHVIIPLKNAGRVTGVMCLYISTEAVIAQRTVKMLQAMGNQIGLAINNARLQEETKLFSLYDPLTGVANRRFMDIMFEQNLAGAKRFESALSLIILNIDHFREYNDEHGQTSGDKLLIKMSKIILKGIRETDIFVRYEGDEFLILLPKTDLTNAYKTAERIRKIVETYSDVTISLGVADYQKGMQKQEELIKLAEVALTLAKTKGRNRTELSA